MQKKLKYLHKKEKKNGKTKKMSKYVEKKIKNKILLPKSENIIKNDEFCWKMKNNVL